MLATPPQEFLQEPIFYQDDLPPPPPRRQRNSRGTKEAKKRRDLRRNRRKLAAQMLDEQLSQTIDQTLARANIPLPPPPPPRASLMPALPSFSAVLKPPEVQLPEFPSFDLNSFPQFLSQTSFTSPMKTPSPFYNIPRWCPPIPSLTMHDIWRNSTPSFYDLSSLPEPKETLEEATAKPKDEKKTCMDVQLWQPPMLRAREHSRFFPSRDLSSGPTRLKAHVKLPTTACKLHASDKGVQTEPTILSEATLPAPRSYESLLLGHYGRPPVEKPMQEDQPHGTLEAVPEHPQQASDEATAANLWRILDARPYGAAVTGTEDTTTASVTPLPMDTSGELEGPLLFTSYEHLYRSPFELDGRELPYVHPNSLIGYCNSNPKENLAVPNYREQIWTDDFGIGLPTVRYAEDLTGLNELMVDHNMYPSENISPLPADAQLPTPEPVSSVLAGSSLLQELPVDYPTEDHERTTSDAHFQSEQALFTQSPPLSLKPLTDVNRSVISIGDFLKLGHARECWCGFCSDQAETATENDTSSTKVTVDDADSAISLESDVDSQAATPELIILDEKDAITEADDGWLLCTDAAAAEEGRSDLYLPSSPVLHRSPESLDAPAPTVIDDEALRSDSAKEMEQAWHQILASSQDTSSRLSESDVDGDEWEEMWEGDLL